MCQSVFLSFGSLSFLFFFPSFPARRNQRESLSRWICVCVEAFGSFSRVVLPWRRLLNDGTINLSFSFLSLPLSRSHLGSFHKTTQQKKTGEPERATFSSRRASVRFAAEPCVVLRRPDGTGVGQKDGEREQKRSLFFTHSHTHSHKHTPVSPLKSRGKHHEC